MTKRTRARWFKGPIFGLRDVGVGVGVGDIALAVLLSAFAVEIVTRGKSGGHVFDAGWTGALAVLLMTLPIIFARRSPIVVAGVLLGGTLFNWAVIGHYVRCGAALPAVFFTAFVIGSRCERRQVWLGMGLLAGAIVAQGLSDPQLGGAGIAVVMIPISLAFMGAGHLLRSRNATVSTLEARTEELREQRELNAKLAVDSDRARITGELDDFLHDRVTEIASAAAAGQATLGTEPGQAQDAFVSIQDTGRETLTHMREVVKSLQDQATTEPQPVLTQLDRLLSQADLSDVQLRVTGDPRMLPPGLELSGYRIVEHLLLTLGNERAVGATVEVAFGTDSLELKVVGPSVRESDARPALAAATERAVLHGGTLRSNLHNGLRETVVLIPLAAGRV